MRSSSTSHLVPTVAIYPNRVRISSTPFMPVSSPAKSCSSCASFSSAVPTRSNTGCSLAMASAVRPRSISSAFTLSRPILSSLSIATVMSVSLSGAPIILAMPASILRLLILTVTGTCRRWNTSSIICTSSSSCSSESEPITSASHW